MGVVAFLQQSSKMKNGKSPPTEHSPPPLAKAAKNKPPPKEKRKKSLPVRKLLELERMGNSLQQQLQQHREISCAKEKDGGEDFNGRSDMALLEKKELSEQDRPAEGGASILGSLEKMVESR